MYIYIYIHEFSKLPEAKLKGWYYLHTSVLLQLPRTTAFTWKDDVLWTRRKFSCQDKGLV